jgi:hypothetical protein
MMERWKPASSELRRAKEDSRLRLELRRAEEDRRTAGMMESLKSLKPFKSFKKKKNGEKGYWAKRKTGGQRNEGLYRLTRLLVPKFAQVP